jgi:leader peptidase (prepilin peptidase) / N-methyltransferase
LFEFTLFFFVLGALLGSFANVVIYRMPLGQSVVSPRSHCYSCGKRVAWYDNIPILTWFFLRGKCRSCKAKFSFRYPVVEFMTACFFAASFWYFGFSYFLIEVLLFGYFLIICSWIDIDHLILPDEFTLSGIVLGLVGAFLNPEREFLSALYGVLFGGGFLFLMAYVYHLIVIMASAILGTILGLILQRKQQKGLKTMIPFGPYLAAAAVIYLFGGKSIGLWYVQTFFPEIN